MLLDRYDCFYMQFLNSLSQFNCQNNTLALYEILTSHFIYNELYWMKIYGVILACNKYQQDALFTFKLISIIN
jgi:hypothetical protein